MMRLRTQLTARIVDLDDDAGHPGAETGVAWDDGLLTSANRSCCAMHKKQDDVRFMMDETPISRYAGTCSLR